MICIPTRNPNIWYTPIVETVYQVMQPIEYNQKLSLRTNAAILQNQGNCDIILDQGFTLEPGQSLMLGNYNELNTLQVDTYVRFIDSTAPDPENPTRLLQYIEITAKLTGTGYFIDQPVINPVTGNGIR